MSLNPLMKQGPKPKFGCLSLLIFTFSAVVVATLTLVLS